VRLLLITDTHVPRRARDLPAEVWERVAEADVVIHAGDWMGLELLDLLETRSRRLLACYGNNDGPELRARVPEVATAELAGVHVVVTHETGSAKGREQRMDRAFPAAGLLVFGHSHIPWDSLTPGGLRLLNPGSPTDRRTQPYATYMTLELDDGKIGPVTVHRLEREPLIG
jgi:putative phosphoesterase